MSANGAETDWIKTANKVASDSDFKPGATGPVIGRFEQAEKNSDKQFLRIRKRQPRCKSAEEMSRFYAVVLRILERKAKRILSNISSQRKVDPTEIRWVLDTCLELEWGNGFLMDDSDYFDLWCEIRSIGVGIRKAILMSFKAALTSEATNGLSPDSCLELVSATTANSDNWETSDEPIQVHRPILRLPQIQTTCAPNAA